MEFLHIQWNLHSWKEMKEVPYVVSRKFKTTNMYVFNVIVLIHTLQF